MKIPVDLTFVTAACFLVDMSYCFVHTPSLNSCGSLLGLGRKCMMTVAPNHLLRMPLLRMKGSIDENAVQKMVEREQQKFADMGMRDLVNQFSDGFEVDFDEDDEDDEDDEFGKEFSDADDDFHEDYIDRMSKEIGPLELPTDLDVGDPRDTSVGGRDPYDWPRHGNSSVLALAVTNILNQPIIFSGGHSGSVKMWGLVDYKNITMGGRDYQQPPGLKPLGNISGAHTGPLFSLFTTTRNVGDNKDNQPGNRLSMPGHTGWVRGIAVDQQYAYSIGCNFIKVWDAAADFKHVGDLCMEGDQLCIAAGDGLLFSGSVDGSLRVWRKAPHSLKKTSKVKEGHLLLHAHEGRITCLVNVDGKLFSCGHDGFVRSWRVIVNHDDDTVSLEFHAEADIREALGFLAVGKERLTVMTPSPPDTGKRVEGTATCASGRYLYVATSGGSLVVVDREEDGYHDDLQVLQITPQYATDRGEGFITSMVSFPYPEGRVGKLVVTGTSSGVIDTWQPVV